MRETDKWNKSNKQSKNSLKKREKEKN